MRSAARQASFGQPTSERPLIEPDFAVSPAVITSDMLRRPDANPNRAQLTRSPQQCAICHGPTGVSRADFPNLAGRYPAVVYKELKDSGGRARQCDNLTVRRRLSDQDMIDLAAYYAYLPRLPAYRPVEMAPRASSSTALPPQQKPPARATRTWTTAQCLA